MKLNKTTCIIYADLIALIKKDNCKNNPRKIFNNKNR